MTLHENCLTYVTGRIFPQFFRLSAQKCPLTAVRGKATTLKIFWACSAPHKRNTSQGKTDYEVYRQDSRTTCEAFKACLLSFHFQASTKSFLTASCSFLGTKCPGSLEDRDFHLKIQKGGTGGYQEVVCLCLRHCGDCSDHRDISAIPGYPTRKSLNSHVNIESTKLSGSSIKTFPTQRSIVRGD